MLMRRLERYSNRETAGKTAQSNGMNQRRRRASEGYQPL